jgi:hypothetical protein
MAQDGLPRVLSEDLQAPDFVDLPLWIAAKKKPRLHRRRGPASDQQIHSRGQSSSSSFMIWSKMRTEFIFSSYRCEKRTVVWRSGY